MANRADRRARHFNKQARGFENVEPLFTGRDSLEDKKLKTELMKMVMLDHLKQVGEWLPEEEAEEMTYRFMNSEGEERYDSL